MRRVQEHGTGKEIRVPPEVCEKLGITDGGVVEFDLDLADDTVGLQRAGTSKNKEPKEQPKPVEQPKPIKTGNPKGVILDEPNPKGTILDEDELDEEEDTEEDDTLHIERCYICESDDIDVNSTGYYCFYCDTEYSVLPKLKVCPDCGSDRLDLLDTTFDTHYYCWDCDKKFEVTSEGYTVLETKVFERNRKLGQIKQAKQAAAEKVKRAFAEKAKRALAEKAKQETDGDEDEDNILDQFVRGCNRVLSAVFGGQGSSLS